MNNNDLIAALGKVGKLFYDTMLGRLNGGNYPSGNADRGFSSIQEATSIDAPKPEGDGASVTIKISLRQAPYAWAYEKGSGIRGPQQRRYPIRPINKEYMVFPEGDWPNYDPSWDWGPRPVKGMFFLTKVLHPGVEKKPYIEPTINQINDEVKKILAQEFKSSFLREGRT